MHCPKGVLCSNAPPTAAGCSERVAQPGHCRWIPQQTSWYKAGQAAARSGLAQAQLKLRGVLRDWAYASRAHALPADSAVKPKPGSGCRSHRRARGPQWSSRWSCWQVHVSTHLQPLLRPRQQGRRSHKAAQSLRAPSTCRHLRASESAWTRSANRAHSSALLTPVAPPLTFRSDQVEAICSSVAADLLSSNIGGPWDPPGHMELELILIAILR